MEKFPLKLSANPLELVRSLPTQLIPIDQIKVKRDRARDEIFVAKCMAFQKGALQSMKIESCLAI